MDVPPLAICCSIRDIVETPPIDRDVPHLPLFHDEREIASGIFYKIEFCARSKSRWAVDLLTTDGKRSIRNDLLQTGRYLPCAPSQVTLSVPSTFFHNHFCLRGTASILIMENHFGVAIVTPYDIDPECYSWPRRKLNIVIFGNCGDNVYMAARHIQARVEDAWRRGPSYETFETVPLGTSIREVKSMEVARTCPQLRNLCHFVHMSIPTFNYERYWRDVFR